MRAAIYLDPLRPEDGCLNVIPGGHFKEYRETLSENLDTLGVRPENLPGRYPLPNDPGDVIFMNLKLFHAALSENPGRRVIQITCFPNTTPEQNQTHFDWLIGYLTHITES